MADKAYDIVLFGATGFTGALTAEYLAGKLASESFTMALAGRNRAKLDAVKQRMQAVNPGAADVALLEA